MKKAYLLLIFVLLQFSFNTKAQDKIKFESTTQQIVKYDEWLHPVDTIFTKDIIVVELSVKANRVTFTYTDKSKNMSYETMGCGKMKGLGVYACSLKDQSLGWGSLVQFKEDEIMLVLSEKMEMKLRSLTKIKQ
jgi:hypothetical protein